MQVNITLLVQVCNFFVAWLLLHKLYFKPAIAALDLQQDKVDEVISETEARRTYVVHKQHEIDICWRKLKQFSRLQMPQDVVQELSGRPEAVALESSDTSIENPLDGSAHEKLVSELKNKIISEVSHVEL